ncbi:MAG: hypothetical protein WC914_00160 [Proteiniphilum sp.]
MVESKLKKQFRVVLFEDHLHIATSLNNKRSFEAKLSIPKTPLKIGWNDWIETRPDALNYHECCGILILFGIKPPSYEELKEQLEI